MAARATRNDPVVNIWQVFHVFHLEKIDLFRTFLQKSTFFHP